MLAFGLSILLFVYWGVLGYAVLAALKIRRNSVQNMLLAPVVGMSLTLLPVFWLNHAGLPIAYFGTALSIVLFLTSIGTLCFLRPILPLKQYWPFAAVLFLALFLTGRPMLEFGFNWLSYPNADMVNYVLGATRMFNFGFFDIPNTEQFVSGSDYSLSLWFFNLSDAGARVGVEKLIAWTSSLTGLLPLKIFMPLILALHLVLISSAGALAHQTRRLRPVALMTCVLLAFSALTSLGTLYQLIAQVSGLGLLIGCTTVLLRPFTDVPERLNLRHGVLVALLVSALSITYPEVTPFLALAFILYWTLGLIRRRLVLRPLLGVFAISISLALVALGEYVLMIVSFFRLLGSVYVSTNGNLKPGIFLYYLVPSGLANLWGFQSIMHLSPEPLLSATIFWGGLLLFLAIVPAGWQAWHLNPPASMMFVMFVLGVRLFMQQDGFGLFKLVMIVQPFLLATVVLIWFQLAKRRVWQVTPLLLLALAGLAIQTSYVETSRGLIGTTGGFPELPGGSQSRIHDELYSLVERVDPKVVVSDTPNILQAELQALGLRGRESTFPSRDISFITELGKGYQWLRPDIPQAAAALNASWEQRFVNADFDLQNNFVLDSTNNFVIDNVQPPAISSDGVFLVTTTPRLNLLNRSQYDSFENLNYVAIPWAQAKNHLIYISSQLGQHYYLPLDLNRVSFFQLERDLYYPGRMMVGFGRYFLFQVVNPTPQTRFVLDLTTTLQSDGKNKLPPAIAIGADRQLFPFVGRGSARVISPPITPQIIEGRPYIMIDMGVDGVRFQNPRTGLMALYGTDISLDSRYLIGFARNISLISEQQYANMKPPSFLGNFPADLANPNLEYSGLYEDGWVAEAAYLYLTQPDTASPLVIRGSVPIIDKPSFSTELIVLVDGQELARKVLLPGEFELRLPVPSVVGRRRIDLRFSTLQVLPAPDRRPAAALLKFIGFDAK